MDKLLKECIEKNEDELSEYRAGGIDTIQSLSDCSFYDRFIISLVVLFRPKWLAKEFKERMNE